ncbi:class I SAM-dependent methyltransferase [Actinacidiphila oryziradicis]|uniref:Class I SAM-dependent methyltransferase n=2 Tax=Actinacidiphila oryziradicis TaxID=2571141 RepID=A0A4U0RVX1_9ACTN|nr:class I SAM-dependent methyltransferase [Actinacidiphila oryziradicis]
MQPKPAGMAGYGENADALAGQYESVAFEVVHREVLHLIPAAPRTIADIGAGTGRDAAALADRGHRVVAVEPTVELRQIGQRLHAGSAVEWVDDALPALTSLHGSFDLILLSAVWMHLDEQERFHSMRRIHELLKSGGHVIMSLRHGPVPQGRRMFEVSPIETGALANRFDLCVVHLSERSDRLGREDVHWSTIALRNEPPLDSGKTD